MNMEIVGLCTNNEYGTYVDGELHETGMEHDHKNGADKNRLYR